MSNLCFNNLSCVWNRFYPMIIMRKCYMVGLMYISNLNFNEHRYELVCTIINLTFLFCMIEMQQKRNCSLIGKNASWRTTCLSFIEAFVNVGQWTRSVVLSQREACNFADVICVYISHISSCRHDFLCLCFPVIVLIISTYKTTIITKLMVKAHHLII